MYTIYLRSFLIAGILFLAGGCTDSRTGNSAQNPGDNTHENEELGQSEEINQTPSAPEARGPEPLSIEIQAKDFVYFPPEFFIEPGREVLFILTNIGENDHSLDIHFPDGEISFEEPLKPGETDTLKATIPMEPGTYTFYCPMDKHRSQGMEGQIHVEK